MLAHCSSVATVAAGFDEEVTVVSLTFDPFREMDRLTSQLLGTGAATRSPRWMPMDLYRVDDHYVVTVDLPGVDPTTEIRDAFGQPFRANAGTPIPWDG